MMQNTAPTMDPLLDEQVPTLRSLSRRFETPSVPRAIWQIVNTLVPYAGLWVAMYFTAAHAPWWATVPLVLLAGLFLVRAFIIFHDCGHGSFFASKSANTVFGWITGVLTFTPYHHWRWEHSIHHATSGNLDERGVGDIWTMTVKEYLAASKGRRFAYRLSRNPLVLFGLGPLFIFVVWQRFTKKQARAREKREVHITNLILLALAVGMSFIYGWKTYLLLQLSVMMVSGAVGLWMFYVQHQFEDGYWENDPEWDHTAAAMDGSSYYKLPKVLQWFSGNIGFHHIHHLNSRIPNYNLERCHKADPAFQKVKPVTFWSSFKTLRLRLWDEEQRTMVGYSALRRYRNRAA